MWMLPWLALAPMLQDVPFAEPVRMEAGGIVVKTEQPGYAAPCWHDVDRDGKKDLVVGQFNDGKMRFYRNLGEGKLDRGRWLQSEGEEAQVPGIW